MIPVPGSPPEGSTPASREGEGGGLRDLAGAGAPRGLSRMLEASPVPALVATTDGIVVGVNEAFVSTWGREGDRRWEGERLTTLFSSGAEELLGKAGSPTPSSFDGRALLQGGAELELRVSVRRVMDPESSGERLVVFASDVTAERRLERAAAVLGTALDAGPADGFFDRLVAGLADALRMEMVLVGRLEPGPPPRVRTLAIRKGGGPGEPFTYGLRGAPCERVVGRVPCVFPSGVADLFPEDHVLAEQGFSSYAGVPLGGADGRPLGLLAALSRRALADGDSACRVLGLFAARAAAEIERREARDDEERREEESRRLVSSIPVGLHHYRLEAGGRLVFTGANPAADAILEPPG